MKVVNKRTHTTTEQDVYIGRPSIFGNPFKNGDRQSNIDQYEEWLRAGTDARAIKIVELLAEGYLDDKNLVCFCAPKPCHGNVLIKLRQEQKLENIFI